MRDAENIEQLVQLPIDYIGFIFYSKSPRFVQEDIQVDIPKAIKKVGVFVNETIAEIMIKVKSYDLQATQLHGDESAALCNSLKNEGLEVIKAFGIDNGFDWSILENYPGSVDYFLFDTKSPGHGGTGHVFNWAELAGYPHSIPYFISGGLSLDNIKQAASLNDSRLYGLDLNSRFEKIPGLKNIETLRQALSIIQHEQISGRR